MSNPTVDGASSGAEARTDALDFRCIMDTVREPLLVLDSHLRVLSANRSFYRTFRIAPSDAEGRLLYELGDGQWNISRLHTLLEEILPDNTAFDDFEVEHDFPDVGRKVMLLNARRLRQEEGERILLAIEDVTEGRQAERERQEIETRFTALVKNIQEHSIFTLDPEGRVTSWNVAAEHILGYTEAEALGRHFGFIFTPEDCQQGLPEAELRAAREHGRADEECWHLRKGGERFWALGIVSALHDAEGRLTGFSKILRDMTAWKRAEQALREREERLDLVRRATRDTIWDWDVENDRQRWNVAGAETFGWTDAVEAPQTATWWADRVYAEDRERVAAGFRRALEDPACQRWQDEYRFLRRDGRVADVLDRGIILRDASGTPKRMVGAMQDITERKATEEALRHNEQRLRLALDAAYTLAFEWDIPRNEVWRHHCRIGTVPETPEERPSSLEEFCAAVHPDDREGFLANLHAALAHPERSYEAEFRVCEADGRTAWLADHGYVECDAQGQPQRLIGLSQDITERKRSEEVTLAANELARQRLTELEGLYRNAPVGLCLLDRDLRYLRINERLSEINGIPAAEHLNKTVREVLPLLADTLEPSLREVVETGEAQFDIEVVGESLARPGVQRTCLEQSLPVKDSAGRVIGVSVVVEDITERKQAEVALRESEERLKLATDATELAVFEWDLASDRVTANDRFRQWYGVGPGEPMMGAQLLRGCVHPSDRVFVEAQVRQALEPGSSGQYCFDYRLAQGDAGRERWIQTRGQVRFEGAGDERQPIRVFGTHLDITDRKRTEARLKASDRRKDAFLATLAHELRNPLAPIRTGLELVQVLRGDAAACEEPLRIMDRQVSHLVRLVDDLLDVSRISRGKIQLCKERLDLAEIIHAALEMSESGLSRGDHQLTVSAPAEPLAVEGDRVRLVQIVANLLNNAAKFTDAGGRINIRVTPRGEWVEIQVQDDGRGIPLERLDHIFEMFWQAEPGLDGGLGIGLSLVRGLVEMHGGTVRAASEGRGSGATFTVSLPLCQSAAGQPTAEKATEFEVLPTQCRVLVVDDNRDIAHSLHLLLTMLGAEVRVAHDGAEALRVCEDWLPTHVLMDIGMPGMDGYEAARRLRAKHPDRVFRLIAVTGWGQEEDRQRAREAGFDEHLVKPVGIRELKTVLSS